MSTIAPRLTVVSPVFRPVTRELARQLHRLVGTNTGTLIFPNAAYDTAFCRLQLVTNLIVRFQNHILQAQFLVFFRVGEERNDELSFFQDGVHQWERWGTTASIQRVVTTEWVVASPARTTVRPV